MMTGVPYPPNPPENPHPSHIEDGREMWATRRAWDEGFAAGRAAERDQAWRWTIHICPKGHKSLEPPLNGVCWQCWPGGRGPAEEHTAVRVTEVSGRAAATPDPPGDESYGKAEERERIVKELREAAHGGNRGQPGSFWVGWRAAARAIEEGWVGKPGLPKGEKCPTCGLTRWEAPDERLREAGVWPDQSAMHGVLLEQIKDAYAEGIADILARLRVRAAEMLPEVARFTLDEIEALAAADREENTDG